MRYLSPDPQPADRPAAGDPPAAHRAPRIASDAASDAARPIPAADLALGDLLVAMRSDAEAVREAAWGACYERYHGVVWTRAFYVMRAVAWLAEPREAAADVASDVFVGLPDAVRHYREEGRAEWWLKLLTVRTAVRRREALTGRWASGRKAAGPSTATAPAADDAPRARGRYYVSIHETAEEIVARLDAVEPDELLELERRRGGLRASPDPQHRRWDEFLTLYVAGYDFREIGARMGLTEGTARNWLCKIRKHLAQVPGAAAGGAGRGGARGG